MCLRVNTLLQGGKYRIIRYINSGGFGCTYEAEHVMLQKRVAIKEFFVKDFCNRDETTAQVTVGITSKQGLVEKLRKKFVEEAQAIFDLQHPNIIRVLDVFEENGTAYYVMDYIDGRSLNELVKREGPLKEARALRYIRQIAAALQYVHDHHRLHLDVKPSNIMIDGSDQAILIDFGTSKQYDEVDGENTSTLMGKTPGYAPIEQMSSRVVQFQPATDIYALGATFYKLLTGITPLEATQLASGEELPPLPDGTSEQVANAICSAMQLNRANRPQNVATFLALLDPDPIQGKEVTVLDAKPRSSYQPANRSTQTIQPPTPPRPTPPEEDTNDEFPAPRRSFPAGAFWGLIVVAIILGGLGGVWLNKAGRGEGQKPTIDTVWNEKMTYGDKTFTYTGPVNEARQAEGKGKGVYDTGTYKGDYVNDCREGEGTFTTADGKNEFTGTFSDNQYDKGKLTFKADGSYFDGTFQEMKPYDGTWYERNGTVICTIKEGKQVD